MEPGLVPQAHFTTYARTLEGKRVPDFSPPATHDLLSVVDHNIQYPSSFLPVWSKGRRLIFETKHRPILSLPCVMSLRACAALTTGHGGTTVANVVTSFATGTPPTMSHLTRMQTTTREAHQAVHAPIAFRLSRLGVAAPTVKLPATIQRPDHTLPQPAP